LSRLNYNPISFLGFFKTEITQPPSEFFQEAGVVTINSKQAEIEGMKFADALDYEYNEGIKEQR
jgi:hypothetical protein